jgi:hypothetical protein
LMETLPDLGLEIRAINRAQIELAKCYV